MRSFIDRVTAESGSTDASGRERLTLNVAASWVSQLVAICVGFVMPRLIHDELGQATLGIWDFGWSIVSYLSLANFGIGANCSKYVAEFRPVGAYTRLSNIMSTAHYLQLSVTLIVFAVILLLYLFVDHLFEDTIVTNVPKASEVLLLLGASLGTQMLTDAHRGIITGCHRWDIHNGIATFHAIVSALGMVLALLVGKGLLTLAAVYFLSTVAAEFLRYLLSKKVCPEVVLSIQRVNREDARLILSFGLKNLATLAGSLSVQQSVNVLIAMKLGPAALAVFARPAALMRHLENFIMKFALVLMPTASSLQGLGKTEELRGFTADMSRVGWFLAVPFAVFLVVFGPELIGIWMGPGYINEPLMAILAIGGGLSAANRVGYRILSGMDLHGRVSAYGLLIYLCTLVAGVYWMLVHDGGLLGAAVIFVAGDVLFNAGLVPFFTSRMLGIPMWRYIWNASHRAILIGILSFGLLTGLKAVEQWDMWINIVVGAVFHGVVVAVLYWYFVLSDPLKEKVKSLAGLGVRG
jgi:O-antigen/teichoic acid export membrane protein